MKRKQTRLLVIVTVVALAAILTVGDGSVDRDSLVRLLSRIFLLL
jgi:small-conductance mechanosensitive channel